MDRPADRWEPAAPAGSLILDLAGMDSDARANLSAATRLDDSLFLAGDEGCCLHRLERLGDGNWGRHRVFDLADYLPLADPQAEVDIEGLAAEDGWLWILGSHACTRHKPSKEADATIDLDKLAELRPMPARALLARVPLVADALGLWRPVDRHGERIAGLVKQTKRGNRLASAFARHPLLAPFTRVPAKEGGIDVEGIAVAGDRVALGMRGPTLGGHAVILEMTVAVKGSGRLKPVADPCVRLLALEGLAIRDLKRQGDDLLILSGPSTAVSGPVSLWRWRGWAQDPPRDATRVRLHRPDWVMDLPHGRGADHPEGLALLDAPAPGFLILNDSPAPARLTGERMTVDRFEWPA